jgi:hypothetical protein
VATVPSPAIADYPGSPCSGILPKTSCFLRTFTVAPHLPTINHVVAFSRPVAFDRFWQHLIKVDGTFA